MTKLCQNTNNMPNTQKYDKHKKMHNTKPYTTKYRIQNKVFKKTQEYKTKSKREKYKTQNICQTP